MKRHPIFHGLWMATNGLLLLSLVLLLYGLGWEYSTRQYLKGFSDAVVPLAVSSDEQVEAILAWMDKGPERRPLEGADVSFRNPENSLNFQELLNVCGSATNAFVNLATSSGLEARRLLLLNKDREAKHVVAEVRIGSRWIAVDPLYRVMLRDARGRLLTKEQLRDPAVFREATAKIPGYLPEYTYERTAHVRLARVPLVGRPLRRTLDRFVPGWDSAPSWSLLVERESFAFVLGAGALVVFSLLSRWILSVYGKRKLGISRARFRDRLGRACRAFFGSTG